MTILTNINNKSKEEIIYELVLSLNIGNSSYITYDGKATPRIDLAIAQYEALVEKGVIKEDDI